MGRLDRHLAGTAGNGGVLPSGTPVTRRLARGFTLVEMLIVVALVGIIATLAIPNFRHATIKARESVLKHDLWVMRDVIDQFYTDKGRYPDSLQELEDAGYLRRIPVDPFTEQAEWGEVYEPLAEDELEGPEDEDSGITDVYSLSEGVALDGTYYRDW